MGSSTNDERATIDSVPIGIVALDDQGRIVEFNRGAEGIFGLLHDAVIGQDFAELIHSSELQSTYRPTLEPHDCAGDSPIVDLQQVAVAVGADGSEIPIALSHSNCLGSGAKHVVACVRESSLRKIQDQLDAETQVLLSSISSVLIHLNSAGVITRWNAPAEAVFGISTSEAIGRDCRSLPWGDSKLAERLESMFHLCGSEVLPNVIVKHSDGTERILDLSVNSICTDGQCSSVLILGNDRTEKSQLEMSLQQAQKLEAIGQLAAGIAHEINTPMQFVKDNIEFLSESLDSLFKLMAVYDRNVSDSESSRPWHERANEIREQLALTQYERIRHEIPQAIIESMEGIHRVIDIVRAMKDFTRMGHDNVEEVDLNAAVQSSVTITRNRWKNTAEMVLDLDPYLPPVKCVQAELSQVLLNLIVNASDALAEQADNSQEAWGRITVRTRYQPGLASLEVTDTGCGIPEHVLSRIFDPFFTTKEVGKGTGQGLTICYNIVVQKLGGAIDVESNIGHGTKFTVQIPMHPDDESASDEAVDEASPSGNDEVPEESIPVFAD